MPAIPGAPSLPAAPKLPKLPKLPVGRAAQSTNFPASYGPQELAALYNAPADQTGAGQSVAVIAEGDLTGPKADLATFEDQNGLPHVNWHQINVGTPTTDTAGD